MFLESLKEFTIELYSSKIFFGYKSFTLKYFLYLSVKYIFIESISINSYFSKKRGHLIEHFHFTGTEFNIAFSYVSGYVILNRTEAGVAGCNIVNHNLLGVHF